MTLFNVDKSSDNRNNPSVNAADVQTNRMAHATTSINPRAEGTQAAGKVTTKDSKIIANDGVSNVGLFGFDDAGNMKVKVAKPGFDANSATDDQLIFNSGQNVFKIVTKLSTSFSVTSTSGGVGVSTVTLNHNLGYVPLAQSVVNISTDWNGNAGIYPIPYFIPATNSGVASSAVFVLASYVRVNKVTPTDISFTIGVLAGTNTIAGTITVYVLQESAT